ncbi:hypothetical protein [Micromonospora sp. NPDC048063]
MERAGPATYRRASRAARRQLDVMWAEPVGTGPRNAPRLEARYGRRRVLLVSGALRALWPIGLFFVMPGAAGVVLVIAVLTALWGVLAGATDVRVAIGVAGVLLLATPFLLPRRSGTQSPATGSARPFVGAAR